MTPEQRFAFRAEFASRYYLVKMAAGGPYGSDTAWEGVGAADEILFALDAPVGQAGDTVRAMHAARRAQP